MVLKVVSRSFCGAAAAVWLTATLSGCSAALQWHHENYVVREGDNLFAIALRFDLSATDLAMWNDLGDGGLIFAGQTLRLKPPPGVRAQEPETGPLDAQISAIEAWGWPARGVVVAKFGDRGGVGKGIDISGKPGDPVVAAAAGKVVYSGSGLVGYGNLVIVKHSKRFLSAYGYNRDLLVREGDQVRVGQRIASVGLGPGRRPLTHFEIRRDGKPVDPLPFLPAAD